MFPWHKNGYVISGVEKEAYYQNRSKRKSNVYNKIKLYRKIVFFLRLKYFICLKFVPDFLKSILFSPLFDYFCLKSNDI